MSSTAAPEHTRDIDKLTKLGVHLLARLPREMAFSDDGELLPFVVASGPEGPVLLDGPFLCCAEEEVADRAWATLAEDLAAHQARSALILQPTWWAPSPFPRPSQHPQRQAVGVLAAVDDTGWGRKAMYVLEDGENARRLRGLLQGGYQRPDVAQRLAGLLGSDCPADGVSAPTHLRASDHPQAPALVEGSFVRLREHLAAYGEAPAREVRVTTPTGVREFQALLGPQPLDWSGDLPQLCLEVCAHTLVVCDASVVDDGSGEVRFRIHALDGDGLQAFVTGTASLGAAEELANCMDDLGEEKPPEVVDAQFVSDLITQTAIRRQAFELACGDADSANFPLPTAGENRAL